ncbi:MAG: hypothetical protein LQ350_007882 [Teloschistes chrysophthalmus]|nr:MAG: hypothetical protein LQ350_007882 [Niorma chrysophthalma]
MRVLNTRSLQFHEVVTPSALGDYAVLSHTWGDGEVSFQDFYRPESQQLQGYEKIKRCSDVAARDGYKYIWIDIYCIDKKSSAELTEAINSMYAWYSEANMCYVYFSDFTDEDQWHSPKTGTGHKYSPFNVDLFSQSRWFTRGWTLQELLASSRIRFLDQSWRYFGDKLTLLGHISSTTGIEARYLRDKSEVPFVSVATRMLWASVRATTRIGDEAYCLMGLFDVNMPLLYGEGDKAFRRLQHEIARSYEDNSLFAWYTSGLASDIFAPNPAAFGACENTSALAEGDFGLLDLELTPPGTFSWQDGSEKWELAIYWGGFAVLEYRLSHRMPSFAVLRHYCSKEGHKSVRFHILDQATTLTAAMRTCYSQRDFPRIEGRSEWHGDFGGPLLPQLGGTQEGDIYTLALSTDDWLPSDQTRFYKFSVPRKAMLRQLSI